MHGLMRGGRATCPLLYVFRIPYPVCRVPYPVSRVPYVCFDMKHSEPWRRLWRDNQDDPRATIRMMLSGSDLKRWEVVI